MTLTPILWNWQETPPGKTWLAGKPDDVPLIWQARMSDVQGEQSHLISLLAADERAREERFRKAGDQLRFVTGRALLRILAGAHLNLAPERLEILQGRFGKPFIAPQSGVPPLYFNVAHSGEWVLLAFSQTHEVGVDIEEIRPDQDWAPVARQVFSADAYKAWAQLNRTTRLPAFFHAWTRHEAGMKALGLGLADQSHALANDRLAYFDLVTPEGYKSAAAWVR